MTSALPEPGWSVVPTEWAPQPVAIAVVIALGAWYQHTLRRLAYAGIRWPAARSACFGVGLAVFLWTTNGFPQAYRTSVYWVWTTQSLLLLLAVPMLLLLGHPLQLARARSGLAGTGAASALDRVLASAPSRFLSNPLVGPALIPLISAAVFYGPVPGWAISIEPVGWVVQLVLVAVGCLVMLPLVGADDEPGSLAVGLSLAIGLFELVVNSLPGLVMRLSTGTATSFFAHRSVQPWTPALLHDQRTAGAVLWTVAQVITIPFLAIVFVRWLRADARDAAAADAVLEAERIVRAGLSRDDEPDDADGRGPADVPWWLSDPEMLRRLRPE